MTLTLANILGARIGAAVGTVLTLIKVGALLAIIVGVFLFGHGSFSHMTGGRCREGLARAVASAIWTRWLDCRQHDRR